MEGGDEAEPAAVVSVMSQTVVIYGWINLFGGTGANNCCWAPVAPQTCQVLFIQQKYVNLQRFSTRPLSETLQIKVRQYAGLLI